MTIIEQRFNEILTANVPRIAKSLETIAKELVKANRLKALELKDKHGHGSDQLVDLVDDVMGEGGR
jgi:hypothetical protein